MPKTKEAEEKIKKIVDDIEKLVEIDPEDKISDVDLISVIEEDDEIEDDSVLDEEEIDPFKDKWEE